MCDVCGSARLGCFSSALEVALPPSGLKAYVFDALNIHHVLMQLYNLSGKGSQHSLFTVAAIFSRGNRGRASVSQFPPAPMSSVDRKRYFLPTHKFFRKGLSTLAVYGRPIFSRGNRGRALSWMPPASLVDFFFFPEEYSPKSQPAVPSPVPRWRSAQSSQTIKTIFLSRAWKVAPHRPGVIVQV